MLEQQPQGIEVSDCATVKIADDIPKEWIVERLHVEDCATVQCSKEQEDAVSMICEDVAEIDSTGGRLPARTVRWRLVSGECWTPGSSTQRSMCCKVPR